MFTVGRSRQNRFTMSSHPQNEARVGAEHFDRAPDHWHIDLAEPWELAFWTQELRCTEADLRGAVASVGSVAGAVRNYFDERSRTWQTGQSD